MIYASVRLVVITSFRGHNHRVHDSHLKFTLKMKDAGVISIQCRKEEICVEITSQGVFAKSDKLLLIHYLNISIVEPISFCLFVTPAFTFYPGCRIHVIKSTFIFGPGCYIYAENCAGAPELNMMTVRDDWGEMHRDSALSEHHCFLRADEIREKNCKNEHSLVTMKYGPTGNPALRTLRVRF